MSSQDGALAAGVREEALDNGFKGAMIGTRPKRVGGNLDVRPGPLLTRFGTLQAAEILPVGPTGDFVASG